MEARATKHRLAAILSADVKDFSRLMERDEVGTHRRLVESRRIMDGAIERHGGRVVGSAGDSVLAEFPSAVGAVAAAVEAQEALTRGNAGLPPDQRLEFRIGINLGEVIVDGDDIFGDGVNIAARLEALAEPGGVYISGRVHDQVGSKLPYPCRARGTQRVKNIARPLRVYSVDWGERAPVPAAGAGVPRRWGRPAAAAVLIAAGAVVLLYATGLDLPSANPLRWLDAPADGPPVEAIASKPTVAVLPFANRSGDPGQEYFSDGVTEDVIAALARFPSLAVLSARAVAPFKGSDAAPAEVGRALGARYLVQGSVRRAGDRVRVAAELVDAERGVVLWSERFDAKAEDVFALQEEIARNVVSALAVRLDRVERERAFARPTDDPQAYDHVLRGRELKKRLSRTANLEARRLFERALELDPNFAMAYTELGDTYLDAVSYGWTEFPLEALGEAEELARRAISLDPRSTGAHRILGSIYVYRGEYGRALEEIDRAIELNPSDAESYAARAYVLAWSGEVDEAIRHFETALRFMPELPRGEAATLGICYYLRGRYDDAIGVLAALVGREPDFALGHIALAAAYAQIGDRDAAAREAKRVRELEPFFRIAQFGSLFRVPEHRAHLAEGLRKAGLPE